MISYTAIEKLYKSKMPNKLEVLHHDFEAAREDDPVLDAIINKDMSLQSQISYLEKNLSSDNRYKKDNLPLEEKHNETVEYIAGVLDIRNDKLRTGQYNVETKRKNQLDFMKNYFRLSGWVGAATELAVGIFVPPVLPFAIGAAAICIGLGEGVSRLAGSDAQLKKERKMTLGLMKKRAKRFDKIINEVYENVPKEKYVVTGKDITDVM